MRSSCSPRTTTSGSPRIRGRAGRIEGLERYGAGTASVRFICGTFAPHHELERKLAELSGTGGADLRLVLERERGGYPDPDGRHDRDPHG